MVGTLFQIWIDLPDLFRLILIFNFLISTIKDGGSKVVLNIFLIERRKGGSFDSPNYYDEDKGIVRNNKVYQQIWDKILPMLQ